MKVILLENVKGIGKRHDVKEINDGYARNFLLPKKLAELATPKALEKVTLYKNTVRVTKEVEIDLLKKNLKQVNDITITIHAPANEKGSLFSSIHENDIVQALKKEAHAEIDDSMIALEHPIKTLGEYKISVQSKGEKASFKLIVIKK